LNAVMWLPIHMAGDHVTLSHERCQDRPIARNHAPSHKNEWQKPKCPPGKHVAPLTNPCGFERCQAPHSWPRCRPDTRPADKGYDVRRCCGYRRRRGIKAPIAGEASIAMSNTRWDRHSGSSRELMVARRFWQAVSAFRATLDTHLACRRRHVPLSACTWLSCVVSGSYCD
jgi:hypothetical protein